MVISTYHPVEEEFQWTSYSQMLPVAACNCTFMMHTCIMMQILKLCDMAHLTCPFPYQYWLLLIGHSFIPHLSSITRHLNWINFGLPHYFTFWSFSILGGTLDYLSGLVSPILCFSLEIIIFDIGIHDIAARGTDTQCLAAAFSLFLRYLSFVLPHIIGLVIIIIPQHFHSHSSPSSLHPHEVNVCIAIWHYLLTLLTES